MKTSIQFATGLVLAAAALAASGSIAHAGEAGAAGSIAAQFTTIPATGGAAAVPNVLSGLSGAVAVGKSSAATGARTVSTTDTFASAFGAAGTLSITNANQVPAAAVGAGTATPGIGYSVAEETVAGLGASQTNSLTGTGVGKATLKFTDSVTTSGIALP